jgi:hypothetical protein
VSKATGVSRTVLVAFYRYTLMSLTTILPAPSAQLGCTELNGLLIFSGLFGVNRSQLLR